jgi:dTDP-4-amino-4,6-dideoxygalactose transaminase
MNSRLDEIQAAVLRVKLKHLDADTEKRRQVAKTYLSGLDYALGCKSQASSLSSQASGLILPHTVEECSHAWHLFVIRHPQRDALAEHLRQAGVQTMIHYPVPPHQQVAYPEFSGISLPRTEAIHREVLSLPISPVMTDSDVEQVLTQLRKFD